MSGWIALSDRDTLLDPAEDGGLLDRGQLVLELAMPLQEPQVLLDYRSDQGGWQRAFSLLYDPAHGIGILHRQGQTLRRHRLPGPLPTGPGLARLIFRWDGPARHWGLRFDPLDGAAPLLPEATGIDPLPLPLSDLLQLCRGGPDVQRHPAVQWFGATRGALPPPHAPWVGQRTPVATPTGFRAAGSLAAGDMVMTRGGAARMLQSVRRIDLPSRGCHAPVLLRAPYFIRNRDLLVSADQQILLTGAEVEYLFSEDEVLVEAQHLTDNRSALFDTRRAVTATVSLDIGPVGLIQSDGLAFASARHDAAPASAPPCRLLRSYEAVPLLALLGRGNGSRAA